MISAGLPSPLRMPQCQGRRTTPKSAPLFFAGCPRLHKNKPLSFLGPARCTNDAEDLCADCQTRLRSTENQLVKRGNKYIPNQETMFHGRISEPIPPWSRLYKGHWFEEQVKAGYTLSEDTQEAVTAMERATYTDINMKPVVRPTDMIIGSVVEVEIPPLKKKKSVIKPVVKPVAKPVAKPVVTAVTKPVSPPPVSPPPVSPIKKKLIVKKPPPPPTLLCGHYAATQNRITLFEVTQ